MLTGKQEAFAVAVAQGATLTDAYATAYAVKPGRSKASIAKDAQETARLPHVAERIEYLRAQVAEKVAERTAEIVAYELEHAMAETDMALRLAAEKENPAAMARIIELRAKLNGLMVAERKNDRAPVQELGHDEARAALEALVAIRKAKTTATAS